MLDLPFFFFFKCITVPSALRKMFTDTSLFCFFQCLKQYVELLIKEGLETAISCPDAACPKQGHLQENEARMAGEIGVHVQGLPSESGVPGSVQDDLAVCASPQMVRLLFLLFLPLD